ncbi:hypothetical protein LNN35_21390 [Pseudomonas stutzeri]|uniref:hypothetical protein n=1 Tax=Stutzerimonas stutzeri TaxID=316 RepID=UPI001E5A354E|nr:hypothetical protein [Stutzerimonas stutzeri]MCC8345320.1 hypothetical protein [Stutzerimonas stutzeri]
MATRSSEGKMICFVTDVNAGEPDILAAIANGPLEICDLRGTLIHAEPAPASGWTHEALLAIAGLLKDRTQDGADAFIAGEWVGSTEV